MMELINTLCIVICVTLALLHITKAIHKESHITRQKTCKLFIERFIYMDCSNLGLDHVPTCSEFSFDCRQITNLSLHHNKIEQIQKGVFNNFTSLLALDLTENHIRSYEEDSFKGLVNLKTLHLGGTWKHEHHGYLPLPKVSYNSGTFSSLTSLEILNMSNSKTYMTALMKDTLCSLHGSVRTLVMNKMYVWRPSYYGLALTKSTTRCIGQSNVTALHLDENNVYLVTADAILNLRKLHYLSLKGNNIIGDPLALFFAPAAHNIKHVDLAYQSVRYNPCGIHERRHMYTPSSEVYSHVGKTSNIQANIDDANFEETEISLLQLLHKLSVLNPDIKIETLPHLEVLQTDFTNGKFTSLNFSHYACWSNNSLKRFVVSYVHFDYVAGIIPCFYRLKYFDVRGLRTEQIEPNVLQELYALETFLASGAIPKETISGENARQLFKNNIKLKYLDFSYLGLNVLNPDLLKPLKNLEVLNISMNELVKLNGIEQLPSLLTLDASYNMLVHLPYDAMMHLKRVAEKKKRQALLNITGNGLICSCASINMIKIFQKYARSRYLFIPNWDDGMLQCILVNNGTRVSLKHALNILIEQCHQKEMVSIVFLGVVFPATIIGILVFFLIFRHRWKFGYLWYTATFKLYPPPSSVSVPKFLFDGFISYNCRNQQWVNEYLVTNLQKRGYLLCVDYIEFMPGFCIVDNIIWAVQSSRSTILVITERYIKSGWCDFELRFAQAHHLQHKRGRMVAIVFPEVIRLLKKHDLPSVRALLDTVVCLEWPDGKYERMVFWMKLCKALGPPHSGTHEELEALVDVQREA